MSLHESPLPLTLASASPRRIDLIARFGIPFDVVPSEAEESADAEGLEKVMHIARLKCDDVFRRMPGRFVLAADTLVCVDEEALGKPKDEAEAADMLRKLSGRWHEVHTGVCLKGPGSFFALRGDTTRVEFIPLTEAMIQRYLQTGEAMDKAGAYAIQGISGMFISRVEGSPSNVIGLPLSLVKEMLEDAGFSLLTEQNQTSAETEV